MVGLSLFLALNNDKTEDSMIDIGSELATLDYRNEPQKNGHFAPWLLFFNLCMLSFHCTDDTNLV